MGFGPLVKNCVTLCTQFYCWVSQRLVLECIWGSADKWRGGGSDPWWDEHPRWMAMEWCFVAVLHLLKGSCRALPSSPDAASPVMVWTDGEDAGWSRDSVSRTLRCSLRCYGRHLPEGPLELDSRCYRNSAVRLWLGNTWWHFFWRGPPKGS